MKRTTVKLIALVTAFLFLAVTLLGSAYMLFSGMF